MEFLCLFTQRLIITPSAVNYKIIVLFLEWPLKMHKNAFFPPNRKLKLMDNWAR